MFYRVRKTDELFVNEMETKLNKSYIDIKPKILPFRTESLIPAYADIHHKFSGYLCTAVLVTSIDLKTPLKS